MGPMSSRAEPLCVFTIGHSNRRADEFLKLLKAHGITGVADVRAVPHSRRNPHFSQRKLTGLLADHGISYRHFPELGGHRRPVDGSLNAGWRNEAFRGYADHMQSPAFRQAIAALLEFAEKYVVAVMCAEAQWSDCHRQLIADALVVRRFGVRHIMSDGEAAEHQLTPTGRVTGSDILYPALF